MASKWMLQKGEAEALAPTYMVWGLGEAGIIKEMDTFVHDEEMDSLLQAMSLEELHEFARTIEYNPFGDAGQTELLSSVNFFLFLQTGELKHLYETIGKAAARLKRLGNKLALSFNCKPFIATTPLDTGSHRENEVKLIAASFGLRETVQLLLERGAGVNARGGDGRTPLYWAAKSGQEAVVQLLLEKGASLEMGDMTNGCTAMHQAALMGHDGVARLLLERGANANAKRKDNGGTPLHEAAKGGHEVVSRLLLEEGANVDAKDDEGETPLHRAAEAGHKVVAQLLMEKGADVNARCKNNNTALVLALGRRCEALVRLLVEKEADIKAKDKDVDPPLHTAAYHGSEAMWADKQRHEAVVRLLAGMGASDTDGSLAVYGPRMKDDTTQALGAISRGRLLYNIEQAQQIMFHESAIQYWVQNLRFVVSASNTEDSDHQFELIENGIDDQEARSEPYIAVSYCWGGNINDKTPLRILVPSQKQRGTKEVRDTRARADILQRSLAFAAAKGIRKVWIDQECIHQDDDEDKQAAIQNMHLVYQQAATTLIILDSHIHTMGDIYALPEIKQFGFATSSSDNLAYLIGWDDGVDVSGDAWELVTATLDRRGGAQRQVVRRQWKLSHRQIYSLASMCRYQTHAARTPSGNTLFGVLGSGERIFTLVDEGIENMEWWGGPELRDTTPESPRPPHWKKLAMLMTSAFTTLLEKDCLRVSDKLALLGNLTDNPHRINTDRAVSKNLSFSACVIALALYNGDVSPLFCHRRMAGYWASGGSVENDAVRPLASWFPFQKVSSEALLITPSTHNRFRSQVWSGSKCLVLNGKAFIKGLLWETVPFHDLDVLFNHCWNGVTHNLPQPNNKLNSHPCWTRPGHMVILYNWENSIAVGQHSGN
ncbi:hypothetical protein FGG08_002264 [Glutinoglossum americanum]|uniref:Heterokaryon incompatibility domain-containing protein n=1 Tax=Glutinoglossum americanum TaxID=1670608 RepID=A0A9P8IBY2_9PEZI|nr:hypothetical protein FGG08_002264 [Glutinoglossum americanum]